MSACYQNTVAGTQETTIADQQSGDIQMIADTREETRTEDRQCGGEEMVEDTRKATRTEADRRS